MTISTFATNTALSISTTEISVVSGTSTLATDTTDGVFCCRVDLTNMAKGDRFVLKMYETARASGTKRVVDTWTFLGDRSDVVITEPVLLLNGWDFTLIRQAGADRTFDCSIIQVA